MNELLNGLKIVAIRIGIILGYSLGIVLFFVAFTWWLIELDKSNSFVEFVTVWFVFVPVWLVFVPVGVAMVLGLCGLIVEGVHWLFVEPFKNNKGRKR